MRLNRIAGTLLFVLAVANSCRAFDTGHHADLTRAALAPDKFSDHAIEAVQVFNWLADKYSAPDPPDVTRSEFEKLHFDNLYSNQAIGAYWSQFAINTHAAAREAAREDDQVKFLAVLGISLHAVQDFYSHSNWAETHPQNMAGVYRTDTWWNSPLDVNTKIHTGWYKSALFPTQPAGIPRHGNYYDDGLNHDAYQRKRWDEAYVFAFAACAEWCAAVCQWADEANPGFVARVRNYQVSGRGLDELNRDLAAAYRISEWISAGALNSNIDGHWKGPGSGRIKMFPDAMLWKVLPDSDYVQALKLQKVQLLLTKNLYGKPTQEDVPAIPAVTVNQYAVILVRTTAVKDLSRSPVKFPNFYARVRLENGGRRQTYIEAMQNKYSKRITPEWRTMHFVDTSQLPNGNQTITIRYELYNEGDDRGWPLPQPDDEPYHIKAGDAEGKFLQFTFDVNSHDCQGDIRGVHDSPGTAATSKGNKGDRGEVTIFVTANSIASPH